MLAVAAPLMKYTSKNEINNVQGDQTASAVTFTIDTQEFPDFSDTNLLDSIDFDDLFMGISDGDVLPDLEMDPELLADFSVSSGEYLGSETRDASVSIVDEKVEDIKDFGSEEEDKVSASGTGSSLSKGDEIMSKREHQPAVSARTLAKDGDKLGRSKSLKNNNNNNNNNNNQGKRKVKVDWTPELHRRFVQAVEQLGVDKAVPSRILELMGIDCLTRHNIASHLQKYRSHRKHLLAREAEAAASWSHRRQMYGAAAATVGGGGGKRDNMNPWIAPTIGFPPMTPPPMHPHHPHFRPLHVWGHPTMDQSLMHIWPNKPMAHSPSPPPPPPPLQPVIPLPPSWAQQPRPPHWPPHHQQVPIPNGLTTSGTPCFPQPLASTRFAAPPVPGIPPHQHAMYKVEPPGIGVPTAQSLIDLHPSKENIDAAIGDALSKPWQPLPLGLKPPSLDSVMGELQRQGVPKIPPSCA